MASWQRLYGRCPWATAGQNPEFARCWYRVYKSQETPVIAFEQRGSELAGLIALYRRDQTLAHVGRYDCEYHVWLAPPDNGDRFVPSVVAALDETLGRTLLELDCLPPETPLSWLAGASNAALRCELGQSYRRVLRVSDPQFVRQYIKGKSRLRTSMNKLKRTGAVSFRRAAQAAEIKRVLRACVPLLELRKGAVYGELPFRDEPRRLEFLLAQAEVPGLLHVTVLERDGDILAAHIATGGRRELSIAGIVHSEFEARHSPGALLLLELISLLCEEGLELLDFTPGDGEYKERFATETQPVYALTVHPRRLGRELRRARTWGGRLAKHAVQRLPGALPRQLQEIRDKLASRAESSALAPRLPSLQLRELALAPGSTANPRPFSFEPAREWGKNAIADLVRYTGERAAYLELLRCAWGHIRAGAQMYTRTSEEMLQALCFVSPGSSSGVAGLPEGIWGCEISSSGGSVALRAEWSRELAQVLGAEKTSPLAEAAGP